LIEKAPVQVGEILVTSGTDKIFPPGIPIGKVAAVEKEYLTQKIDVEPFFIKSPIKRLIIASNDQQALLSGEK
jgi:cell shape-determining protein MreC